VVNDISAGRDDPGLLPLVAARKVTVVLMHMQGTPATMQKEPHYADVVSEVKAFLSERIAFALDSGIERERLVIDPGIGFGKNLEHNLALIRAAGELAELGCPVLIGPSRKAFISKILGLEPGERLEGSLAAVVAAVLSGAHMVRVHDVKAVKRAVAVADALRREDKVRLHV